MCDNTMILHWKHGLKGEREREFKERDLRKREETERETADRHTKRVKETKRQEIRSALSNTFESHVHLNMLPALSRTECLVCSLLHMHVTCSVLLFWTHDSSVSFYIRGSSLSLVPIKVAGSLQLSLFSSLPPM